MSHPCFVTQKVFKYTRSHGPLFIVPPKSVHEARVWESVMNSLSREFHYRSKMDDISHNTMLSSGTTLGEFAMYTIASTHTKRLQR